ncbi:MAG: selenocysteine-specific translation elongation factor [Burkholderiaceae bacterium]
MLIGTAGHIDHGKTRLVQRLTGRNTDRLPEEQRRGISIELGYAYRALATGEVIGLVDVPGHERFVRTMLAGAGGIDFALLVVAADDGVMPQTVEHFEILRLLGIDRGAVAITKIDLAGADLIAATRAGLARLVAASPAADWPVFEVSSASGAGLGALEEHLIAAAHAHAARQEPGGFRLAVDRVFTLAGMGTVVTGRVHSGRVSVGDEVQIAPRGLRTRVRSLHAQDRAAPAGHAGERCALNLVGVARDQVKRGDWVQTGELANTSERFDARLELSPHAPRPLAHGSPVHLHIGTRDLLARVAVLDAGSIEPGGSALVAVQAVLPLAVCRGDRFILRDAAGCRTLGGGVVIDTAPPTRGRRKPERLALLKALSQPDREAALAAWLAHEPVAIERLAHAWNLGAADIDALLATLGARRVAAIAFSNGHWQRLQERTLDAVTALHEREPEMPGLEQNRLRRIVAPSLPTAAMTVMTDELLAAGRLERRGAFLASPQHRAELAHAQRLLWERTEPLLAATPWAPPRVRDIARALGEPESAVRTLLQQVTRIGATSRVAHDHFFLTRAVAEMAEIASAIASETGAVRAADFRDRIGGGRKLAIQVLEFFDRVAFTRRVGDDHRLRRSNPWAETQGVDR